MDFDGEVRGFKMKKCIFSRHPNSSLTPPGNRIDDSAADDRGFRLDILDLVLGTR